MNVCFWGVRGSISAPLAGRDIREKGRQILLHASPADVLTEASVDRFLASLPQALIGTYGGNTPSIELRSKKGELIILDGGSGIRGLGQKLMNKKEESFSSGRGEGHLILTHTHWDHIQGIPFFEPLYVAGNIFHICSAIEKIEERLREQQNNRFFPVALDGMAATKKFHQLRRAEKWLIGDINISQIPVPHPGGCYAYRFEEHGRTLILCSDAEFKAENLDVARSHLEFLKGADLLIFDAHYSDDQLNQRADNKAGQTTEKGLPKMDWGHSSAITAIDIAIETGARRLALFHHNPRCSDSQLEQAYIKALQYKSRRSKSGGFDLEVVMAYEGLELEV